MSLIAFLLLIVWPGASNRVLAPNGKTEVSLIAFLLLMLRPGVPNSVLAPNNKARCL